MLVTADSEARIVTLSELRRSERVTILGSLSTVTRLLTVVNSAALKG
jgi:hypothetical protein